MSIVTRQGREFNPHAGQSMSVFLLLKSRFYAILTAQINLFFSFSILKSWLVFTYIRATCFTSLTPRTQ